MKKLAIIIISRGFMFIYTRWAKGKLSKEQAHIQAKWLFEQMKWFSLGFYNLKMDHNILVDLGIKKPNRGHKNMATHEKEIIADFLLTGPILEGSKRLNMLGFNLDINPDNYKTEWESPITDQEKTLDPQSNAYTFLNFCCAKNESELNSRLKMISQ